MYSRLCVFRSSSSFTLLSSVSTRGELETSYCAGCETRKTCPCVTLLADMKLSILSFLKVIVCLKHCFILMRSQMPCLFLNVSLWCVVCQVLTVFVLYALLSRFTYRLRIFDPRKDNLGFGVVLCITSSAWPSSLSLLVAGIFFFAFAIFSVKFVLDKTIFFC